SDYNVFWNSTSQSPIKFGSTIYSTVAAYASASGRDTHSLQLNPQFMSAAVGDFHLQSTSPAIDAAKSDAPNWPATDADGHVRVDLPGVPNTGVGPVPYADRGAFEYFVASNLPPAVSAPASATVNENVPLTINVTASDPNGEAITSLTATGVPSGATFTPGPGNTSGTLSWTPGYTQSGPYSVTFTATNSLTGSATTAITVNNVDR